MFGGRANRTPPPWKTGSRAPAVAAGYLGEAGEGALPVPETPEWAEDSRLLLLRFFFL